MTVQQNHALDKFLDEYSDRLMHVAAWIAREEGAPAGISEESTRLLQQAFRDQASQNSQAVYDTCEKMISSFLMLRNEC